MLGIKATRAGGRGSRFLLTPGWWPEDQEPTGPGRRAASLSRVLE